MLTRRGHGKSVWFHHYHHLPPPARPLSAHQPPASTPTFARSARQSPARPNLGGTNTNTNPTVKKSPAVNWAASDASPVHPLTPHSHIPNMSSAAVSQRPPTTAGGDTKRRSLFKPSTWKKSSREQAHDAVEHAGVDAPNGRGVTGLNTIDGVETGAPLTSLTGGEGEGSGTTQQPQSGPSNASSQPAPPQPTTSAAPSSGIAHEVDTLGRILFFRQDAPNYHLSNSCPSYPVYFNNTRYAPRNTSFNRSSFPLIRKSLRKCAGQSRPQRPCASPGHTPTNTLPAGSATASTSRSCTTSYSPSLASGQGCARRCWRRTRGSWSTIVRQMCFGVLGGAGTGRNVLGKVLMDVREVLRVNAGVGYGSGAKTM